MAYWRLPLSTPPTRSGMIIRKAPVLVGIQENRLLVISEDKSWSTVLLPIPPQRSPACGYEISTGNPNPWIPFPFLPILDHESLNLVLDGSDLSHKITGLVGGDAGSNHGARHAGRAAQGKLAGDEHVGSVLVLGKQGQMKEDSQGVAVSGENHNLGSTAVQRLGSCIEVNR